MQYDDICAQIMASDNSIRFVGVVGRNGDLLCGGYKDGKEGLLDKSETKMSMHYASLRWDMRKNLSHRIGNEKFSMTIYDKVQQFSIPINNDLLLISTKPDAEYNKMIPKILKLINEIPKIS